LEAGSWACGGRIKKQIFVGAAAIIWAIWCTRNDIVFDKKNKIFLLCRLFLEEHIGYDLDAPAA
jgi:hypothetical protein